MKMEKERTMQGLDQEKLVDARKVAKRMLVRGLSKEMVCSVVPELSADEVEWLIAAKEQAETKLDEQEE